MAREQRTDVDYFPHECNHGRKMYIIEEKFGNDGYATWFKLLEQLGKAKNHYIDFSDDMTLMFLSSIFRIDQEKTIEILTYLSKVSAIDKYLFENHKVIYSQKFCDSITDAYRRRKTEMLKYDDILNEIKAKNAQTDDILTSKSEFIGQSVSKSNTIIHKEEYSIIKNSKEEEIKENKTKVDYSFDFKKKLIDYGFRENLVNDWVLIRKNKNATNTETAFNKFIREVSLSPDDKNEILEFIVGKEWKTFEYQWLLNLQEEFKQQQDKKYGKSTAKKSNVEYSEEFLGKHLKNLQS